MTDRNARTSCAKGKQQGEAGEKLGPCDDVYPPSEECMDEEAHNATEQGI
jgi:hypothetical protein